MYYTNVEVFGDSIYVRYSDRTKDVIKFDPTYWIHSSKPSDWKTLEGHDVQELKPGGIREAREFIKSTKEVSNLAVYGDINFKYQWISRNNVTQWSIKDIVIAFMDIEVAVNDDEEFSTVEEADGEITAIAIHYSNLAKKLVFGCGDYTPADDVEYVKCRTELELLDKFLKYWQQNPPDIITGWYVRFFDIPYLINRFIKLFGIDKTKRLSPWKILNQETIEIKGKDCQTYNMSGISVLDFKELFMKFGTYSAVENEKLDHIAEQVLGEKKLDYSEYGTLDNLCKQNFQLFIEYNIRDIDLIIRMEAKLKLIELACQMAYDGKVNYNDVFSQIRMWDAIIYNYLLERKIVIPSKRHNHREEIEGGYVKDVLIGLHEWVVAFDLTSLYPHLMMMFNISPETFTEKMLNVDKEKIVNKTFDFGDIKNEYCIAGNGAIFLRDKSGFLPELMRWMFKQRKEAKNKMFEFEQILENINVELKRRGYEAK